MPGGVLANRGARQPGEQPPPIAPNFQYFGDPASFTAAAGTQASDYDTIMQNYQNLINSNRGNPIIPTKVSPTLSNYHQSQDVTNSLADLSNLATTGGYTPQGIADIRARDISPTRSIYANAQQNVDRARALGGGYSPNANATQASMARDESSQISDINTSANAGIAQNVAANELAASGAYGSAAGAANAQQAQAGEFDANTMNQTGEFNAANAFNAQLQNRNSTLGAIQGETSLYGTTPALTKTFGDQVMQAQGSNQNQQNIDNTQRRALFGY